MFQRSSGIQNFFIISFNGVFISWTDFIFLLSTSYVCFPFDYFRLLFGISPNLFFFSIQAAKKFDVIKSGEVILVVGAVCERSLHLSGFDLIRKKTC